jgi:hypothetical protein
MRKPSPSTRLWRGSHHHPTRGPALPLATLYCSISAFGHFASAPGRWGKGRTCFAGVHPWRWQELFGGWGWGRRANFCALRWRAPFLGHRGDKLHFWVTIYNIGWRRFLWCIVSSSTYFGFGFRYEYSVGYSLIPPFDFERFWLTWTSPFDFEPYGPFSFLCLVSYAIPYSIQIIGLQNMTEMILHWILFTIKLFDLQWELLLLYLRKKFVWFTMVRDVPRVNNRFSKDVLRSVQPRIPWHNVWWHWVIDAWVWPHVSTVHSYVRDIGVLC